MHALALASIKDLSRDDWLALRRQGIGGSDVAAIAGVSKYRTPMDVYLDKIGEGFEQAETEEMYWGTLQEPLVADEFAKRSGFKVTKCRKVLQHPAHPFMLANLDRLIIGKGRKGRGVLEVKNSFSAFAARYDGEHLPDEWICQIQHYLAVTGLQWGFLAVLATGRGARYAHYEVLRDEGLIETLIQLEEDFWEKVQTRTPPPVDGSDASTRLLNRLYEKAERGTEIELPSDADRLITHFEQSREYRKQAERTETEWENRLKVLVGTAEVGRTLGGRKVSWTNVTTKRLDTDRLKEEQPQLYTDYLRETFSRRFSVK